PRSIWVELLLSKGMDAGQLANIERGFTLRRNQRWIAHTPVPGNAERWDFTAPTNLPEGDGKFRQSLLLIGPEGGFSPKEVESAREAGFAFLNLGPRRLRAETAAIVAASLLLNQFGDLQ
ncbi:MAG: RsmE family RNA methyltransferase, partial [Calditrichaeota bacterium]